MPSNPSLPEEAVEKAAQADYARQRPDDWKELWDSYPEPTRDQMRERIRPVLQAAAPAIRKQERQRVRPVLEAEIEQLRQLQADHAESDVDLRCGEITNRLAALDTLEDSE